jgi:hypothetical protein
VDRDFVRYVIAILRDGARPKPGLNDPSDKREDVIIDQQVQEAR